MNSLPEFQDEIFAKLDVRMSGLGFRRLRRYAYISNVGPEAIAYAFCRPKKWEDSFSISPILAIENLKLRALIGEDEPRQQEPRFANLYVAHTVGRAGLSWDFNPLNESADELASMTDAMLHGAIPFAQKWGTFEGAVELIEEAWAGRGPKGIIIHPTVRTAEVFQGLRA